MKFRSPTETALSIGLTSGHTCVIPPPTDDAPEGVEIDARFHRKAIAEGAIPSGIGAPVKEDTDVPSRSSVIEAALQAMLDGNEESDFKKDGTPDMNAVTHRCGFKVQRPEVEALWAKVKAAAA